MRKKIRILPNVIKVQSEMMLVLHNVIMELPNVRKKNGITKYDKSIDICNVSTT